jgi:hypothetical protein
MLRLMLQSVIFDTFARLTWFAELQTAPTDAKMREIVAKMVTTWRDVLVLVRTVLLLLFFYGY